jgi:hypothetical protein
MLTQQLIKNQIIPVDFYIELTMYFLDKLSKIDFFYHLFLEFDSLKV